MSYFYQDMQEESEEGSALGVVRHANAADLQLLRDILSLPENLQNSIRKLVRALN